MNLLLNLHRMLEPPPPRLWAASSDTKFCRRCPVTPLAFQKPRIRERVSFSGPLRGDKMKATVPEKEFIRSRLREAPLRREREQYLLHLLKQGTSKLHVRVVASRLLHINRLLGLNTLCNVHTAELEVATRGWVSYIQSHQTRLVGASTAYTFRNTAENWLRFHNLLVVPAIPIKPFDTVFADFMHYIAVTRPMSPDSIDNHRKKILHFLAWAGKRRDEISSVSLNLVDEYLEGKRSAGLQPRSMAAHCQSLRTFFQYTGTKGLSEAKIVRGIKSPRIPRSNELPKGPRWSDVRRLLTSTANKTAANLRTTAILFLCSIYGLRGIEIRGLTIDDFDWVKETFSVHRAKGGKIQEFPIQFEVGEAVLRYLRHGRPLCSSRYLFVTLKPPHRVMNQTVLAKVVGFRMKSLGIELAHYGTHSLRHACATELLHQGCSLIEIADFLGHRDIKSVGIYAKLDARSLLQVAAFSLAGLK
jgi:integrase/recombinase XerD